MLLNISGNLRDGGKYFYNYKIKEEKDFDVFRLKMKEFENKGDKLVDELTKELINLFITPIEREDVLELASHIDNILNGFEECASRFYIYKINKIDNYMLEFSDLLNKCVIEIHNAVELLSQKRLTEIIEHTIKIKEYEKKCDVIERNAIKELFEREKNLFTLIQYKEIYEILENIADECQKVAKTIANDIVDVANILDLTVVIIAALISAIAWNLITWYFGISSSSSHTLIGPIEVLEKFKLLQRQFNPLPMELMMHRNQWE